MYSLRHKVGIWILFVLIVNNDRNWEKSYSNFMSATICWHECLKYVELTNLKHFIISYNKNIDSSGYLENSEVIDQFIRDISMFDYKLSSDIMENSNGLSFISDTFLYDLQFLSALCDHTKGIFGDFIIFFSSLYHIFCFYEILSMLYNNIKPGAC